MRRGLRWAAILIYAAWAFVAVATIILFATVQHYSEWETHLPPFRGGGRVGQFYLRLSFHSDVMFASWQYASWPASSKVITDPAEYPRHIHPAAVKFTMYPVVPFEGCALPSSIPPPPPTWWERMKFYHEGHAYPLRDGGFNHLHGMSAPRWFCVGITSAPVAGLPLLLMLKRTTRSRRRRRRGLCVGCGYDLRASSDRCPECGTSFVARAG